LNKATALDKLVLAGVVVSVQQDGSHGGMATLYRADATGAEQGAVGYSASDVTPGSDAVEAAAADAIKQGWLKAEAIA
jgi:hypothetical protein